MFLMKWWWRSYGIESERHLGETLLSTMHGMVLEKKLEEAWRRIWEYVCYPSRENFKRSCHRKSREFRDPNNSKTSCHYISLSTLYGFRSTILLDQKPTWDSIRSEDEVWDGCQNQYGGTILYIFQLIMVLPPQNFPNELFIILCWCIVITVFSELCSLKIQKFHSSLII